MRLTSAAIRCAPAQPLLPPVQPCPPTCRPQRGELALLAPPPSCGTAGTERIVGACPTALLSRRGHLRRVSQQAANFLVGRLGEVVIPGPDRVERLRLAGADRLVRLLP